MKITSKEIGISGLLILGSGLVIGCISALCENKTIAIKQAPEKSSSKKDTTPVVQMKIVPENEPISKPKQATEIVDPPMMAIQKEAIIDSEVKEVKIKEGKAKVVGTLEQETEIDEVTMSDTSDKITPELPTVSDDFPLQLGSKGERVFALQKYLLKYHGWSGNVTDQYDQKLADRVLHLLKVNEVDKRLFNKLMSRNKRRR
ncbi:hypothetical protein [uncultured Dokdonia sp.]|uniref:hypothetical protein n=1 Tax=uncultured Dokdonia sp. TaxID=575653 RepID=UPI00261A3E80|nr:hypothetical protein [uncultured Dokdonia sp.]